MVSASDSGQGCRVLFTESADVLADTSAVVQAFAGHVELTAVRGLRTAECVLIAEFPPLSPPEARALADNLSHGVRRDPWRTPQEGDGPAGSATLNTTNARITCCPADEDATRLRLFAVVNPTDAAPGELVSIQSMRRAAALKIADALRIGAACAESGEAFAPLSPATAPEPQRIEGETVPPAACAHAVQPIAPQAQRIAIQPNAEPAGDAIAPSAARRIHPLMAARLARAERNAVSHAYAAPMHAETPGESADE